MLPFVMVRPPSGYGVLTTTGRRTGKVRRKCIRAIRRGDRAYIVQLRPPEVAMKRPTAVSAWVWNIRAQPRVSLRMRGGTFAGTARELHDPAELEQAREAICETVVPNDYGECALHLRGRPTREKIKELHRYWFDTGIPVVVELEETGGCEMSEPTVSERAPSQEAARRFFDRWARFYGADPCSRWIRRAQRRALDGLGARRVGSLARRRLRTGRGRLRGGAARRPRDRPRLVAGDGRARPIPGEWHSERRDRRGRQRPSSVPDGAFTAVLSTTSFHHYPEPDRSLGEMRRVLEPSGRIALGTSAPIASPCAASTRSADGTRRGTSTSTRPTSWSRCSIRRAFAI